MKRMLVGLLMISLMLAVVAPPMAAQSPSRASRNVSFEKLSTPAGIIFTGTVLRIERVVADNSEPATVRVTFRVDGAVRGCITGDTVELDEWAELWVRNDRYRTGQRVLLFLYPPSDAGLTSPVAGDLGKVQIGPQGLLLTPQQARFLSSQSDVASSQSDARPTHGESHDSARIRLRSQKFLTPSEAGE